MGPGTMLASRGLALTRADCTESLRVGEKGERAAVAALRRDIWPKPEAVTSSFNAY